MKIQNLYISKYKIFENFDLTFSEKSQNLIVIAGINGSGKTTLLDFIYNYVTNNENRNNNKIKFSESKAKNILYFKANEQNIEKADKVIIEYIDNLIFEKKLNPEVAYKKVNEILFNLFSDFNLQIKFKGLNRKKQVFFTTNEDKELQISELSGGEKEILTKIFSLYLSETKNSLILIDEPENSLHPIWQNRIAPIYQKFAEQNNNQIIFATHSPQIVGSVKKEQIRVLVKEDNKIKVFDKFNGSYGWQTEKILLEIFRTNEVRTVEIEKKLSKLQNLILSNKHNTEQCEKLFAELEKILGYDDNDLVLLRVEIAKRNRKK
ncbi:MAG: AAA family ATPase [Bacteroidota bacterium]|nr:AAA family ATPase [Bacteroidota bacterium]